MRTLRLSFVISLCALQLVAASTALRDPGVRTPSFPGSHGALRGAQDVLVIRDFLPWGGNVVPAFEAAGANVTVIPTTQITSTNLNDYCVVFVTAGTLEAFNPTAIRLNNAVGLFNSYLANGGHLLYVTGTWGAAMQLPGGVQTVEGGEDFNVFTDANALSVGMPFPEFEGSLASHDLLVGLPDEALVHITNLAGAPTAAEYAVGGGTALAMTQPLECYIPWGDCHGSYVHMTTLLENAIGYMMEAGNCVGIPVAANDKPLAFELMGNHPNPFNPVTTISFSLAETGPVRLLIHDLAGARVATLADGMLERGAHSFTFNGNDLGSGLYFYRLEADGQAGSGRMLLVK
ncbi:MAG: hypothetical protein Q8O14_13985 [bacterium]|nr:hypothetical protein [bacterium]